MDITQIHTHSQIKTHHSAKTKSFLHVDWITMQARICNDNGFPLNSLLYRRSAIGKDYHSFEQQKRCTLMFTHSMFHIKGKLFLLRKNALPYQESTLNIWGEKKSLMCALISWLACSTQICVLQSVKVLWLSKVNLRVTEHRVVFL